jgi:hypothetical protein
MLEKHLFRRDFGLPSLNDFRLKTNKHFNELLLRKIEPKNVAHTQKEASLCSLFFFFFFFLDNAVLTHEVLVFF